MALNPTATLQSSHIYANWIVEICSAMAGVCSGLSIQITIVENVMTQCKVSYKGRELYWVSIGFWGFYIFILHVFDKMWYYTNLFFQTFVWTLVTRGGTVMRTMYLSEQLNHTNAEILYVYFSIVRKIYSTIHITIGWKMLFSQKRWHFISLKDWAFFII